MATWEGSLFSQLAPFPMLLTSYSSSLSLNACLASPPAPASLNLVLWKMEVMIFTRAAPASPGPAVEEVWRGQAGFSDGWEVPTSVGCGGSADPRQTCSEPEGEGRNGFRPPSAYPELAVLHPPALRPVGTLEIGHCIPWSLLFALQHFFASQVGWPRSWFPLTLLILALTLLPSGKPLSPRQTRKVGHPEASDTN